MRANIFLAALLILAYITISSTYAIEMSGGMSISSADEPCFGEGIFLQDADGSISSMESSGHIDYHQCHWVYDMPEKFAKVQLDVDNGIVDNYGFYVYPNEDITSDSNYVRAYQNFEVEDASNINALASASNIEGSQTGTDIRLVGDARRAFPFSVECKWQENWSIPSWIEQAKANQMDGTDWLLVVKKSRTRPIVVMDAEQFFNMLDKDPKDDSKKQERTRNK